MTINDVHFEADLPEILAELQHQLALNQIPLLQKMKDSGDDIMVQCPYHGNGQERRPSAGIRKRDGLLHCFACGETHPLIEVISHCFGHYEDLMGVFGYKWLCKNFATVAVEERKPIELNLSRRTKKSTTSVDRQSNENTYVTEQELDKYRYTHPYWAKRGITDEHIIELFDLGVDLQTNEITMPNYDKYGNCVFVARRSIKTKYFSYPRNVNKIVYGIYQLYKLPNFPKEVYITESMIDCIYLWQFNKYACALNGLGSSSQFEDLRGMPCRKFILATDNDKAGMHARERLRKELPNKIITEVVLPPNRKDINECTPEEIYNMMEVF